MNLDDKVIESLARDKIRYPFKNHSQDDKTMASLVEEMEAWSKKHRLFKKNTQYYVGIACEYVKYCSNPGLTQEQLYPLCLFMVVFYYLNDFSAGKDEFLLLKDEVDKLFSLHKSKHLVSITDSPIKEFNFLLQQVAKKSGTEISYFDRAFRELLQAMEEEFILKERGNEKVKTADYLKLRETFVAVYPYFEVWKIASGFTFKEMSREKITQIKRLEKLTNGIIFLSNDLASLRSDIKKDKLNSILCWKNENSTSLEEAWKEIKAWHDEKVREFDLYKKRLAYSKGSLLCNYIQCLEIAITGNLTIIHKYPDRYIGI